MNRNMKLTVDGVMLEINEKQHILNNNKDIEEENADWDRCTYTWDNLYQKLYTKRVFWSGGQENFRFRIEEQGRKGVHIVFNEVKISGDVVFNFGKSKKGKQKYERYENIITKNCKNKTESEKRIIDDNLKILEECFGMNYSLHNFAFMPVTGGMNNFKGNVGGLDRLDTFLYYLNQYYTDRNDKDGLKEGDDFELLYGNTIFSYVNPSKRFKKSVAEEDKPRFFEERRKRILDSLISFLDEFRKGEVISGKEGICSATYKYCSEMYLLDYNKEESKKLVEDLIENGSKPIETGDDVIRYMNLAKRYWKIKDELLKQAESRE